MSWRDRPAFLCGHRKSGTTLLLSLFDAHPQLCVFPPDSGFFYGYFPRFEQPGHTDDERIARVIDVMYGNLRRDLERLGGPPDLAPVDALAARFRRRMAGRPCTARTLLVEAVTAYHDVVGHRGAPGPRGWIEKTTSTEIYAGEVAGWFPEARFVQVIRDPRDNFASLRSGWEARYRDQNDSIQRLLQSMLDRGMHGMRCARANIETLGGDRYRVVRYEDLVTDPAAAMRDLAAFVGIDWHERLLQPTWAGLPWPGNSFEGRRFDAASAVNVGRWPQRITPHEARVIEFHFADVMAPWGYEPTFTQAQQAAAAAEHYKWLNFAQRFAETFSPQPA